MGPRIGQSCPARIAPRARLHLFDVDPLGLFAAASVAAWALLKQHRTLAASYGTAAQELPLIRLLLEPIDNVAEWARAVSEAEEAISREHAL